MIAVEALNDATLVSGTRGVRDAAVRARRCLPEALVRPVARHTQTRPSATARPAGLLPTSIVCVTSLVAGSMRVTVPSPGLATQIEPPPTAMATGRSPTGIVKTLAFVLGSMRATVSSARFATQTAPWP